MRALLHAWQVLIYAASVSSAISFVPGAPSASQSTFTASPNTLVVSTSVGTVLTFKALDASGNAVPGQSVAFSASGANYTFGTTMATTDANGAASTTLSATKAETKTVTATTGSALVSTAVTFVVGAFNATASTFVANPNFVQATNANTTVATLTARDVYGNPVANQTVTFSASGVMAGQGTGMFAAPTTQTVLQGFSFLVTADLTNDSVANVVAVSQYQAGFETYLG